MTDNTHSGAGTGAAGGRRERMSRAFDFMRQRLEEDAARVRRKDIEELDKSVPAKLGGVDLRKLEEELGWVGEMVGRVRTLWSMIRDKGFRIDGKTKTLIAAGLIYFVLPTDLTPDFIPGIGYLDDALVLATLWKLVSKKIDEYVAYRQSLRLGAGA